MKKRNKKDIFTKIFARDKLLLSFFVIMLLVLFIKLFIGNNESLVYRSPIDLNNIDPDNLPTYDNVEPNKLIKEILNSSQFGRFLLGIDNFLEALNPVFKIFMGTPYSLTIDFLLVAIMWISIVIIIWKGVENALQIRGWISFLIGLIITTIGSRTGILVNLAGFIAPIFREPILIVGAILLVAIGNIIYSKFMKRFGDRIKERKKKEDEERREGKNKLNEQINDIRLKASGIRPNSF